MDTRCNLYQEIIRKLNVKLEDVFVRWLKRFKMKIQDGLIHLSMRVGNQTSSKTFELQQPISIKILQGHKTKLTGSGLGDLTLT